MLLEIVLRSSILVVSIGAILIAGNLSIWSVRPIYNSLAGITVQPPVSIEPVGLIEKGAIKQLEGKVLARRLEHRVEEIFGILLLDQKDALDSLQKSQIYLVPANDGGATDQRIDRLDLNTGGKTEFTFQAELFKLDVAGFANWVAGRLDKHDSIRTMLEVSDDSSRLFLEIDRVNGAKTRAVEDGPGTLSAALDRTACAVALDYLKEDPRYAGMTSAEFCAYVAAMQSYHGFVARAAERSRKGHALDTQALQAVIAQFQDGALARSQAPAIDLMLAGLFRMDKRPDEALVRLERAARILPDHAFVVRHLAAWTEEQKARMARPRQMAQAQQAVSVSLLAAQTAHPASTPIQVAYAEVRGQEALVPMRYAEMIEAAAPFMKHKVRLGIMASGFTPFEPPHSPPEVLPARNFTQDSDGLDGSGFGNATTHYLAALLPFETVEILPIKVIDDNFGGDLATFVDAASAVPELGVNVLAVPLGYPSDTADKVLDPLFQSLREQGIAGAGLGRQRPAGQGRGAWYQGPGHAGHGHCRGRAGQDWRAAQELPWSRRGQRAGAFQRGDHRRWGDPVAQRGHQLCADARHRALCDCLVDQPRSRPGCVSVPAVRDGTEDRARNGAKHVVGNGA